MSDSSGLLSLPRKAPISYLDLSIYGSPIAIYTLVDLNDSELDDLRRFCESKYVSNKQKHDVVLAPQPRFVGQPLRAVFDSHVELGKAGLQHDETGEASSYKQDYYDPVYFLVALHRDWKSKGILMVTLDDDDIDDVDMPGNTDKLQIKADQAALMFANLTIGNESWEDCKEISGYRIEDVEDVEREEDDGGG